MDEKLRANITHIGILLILLVVLLGVLVFTGILGCNAIPGVCEIYYRFVKGGQPVILVAYGESGLGDHEKLLEVLNGRDLLKAQARAMSIDKLSYGNIRDYDLIIVERARKICSEKLKLFEYYVNSGGRLVWTGDAGTELCVDDRSGRYTQTDNYLLEKERVEGGSSKIIGPWARRDGDRQLSFDEFLGISYRGNYCDFAECKKTPEAGRIEVVNNEHKLAYGLSPSIPYKGNFAVVEISKSSNTRLVAVLNYGTNFLAKAKDQPWLDKGKTYNFGKTLPFIAASGVGERVAYYAVPIESFVSEDQPQKNRAIIEQMYYGMLYE